jgi:hypothetical protein
MKLSRSKGLVAAIARANPIYFILSVNPSWLDSLLPFIVPSNYGPANRPAKNAFKLLGALARTPAGRFQACVSLTGGINSRKRTFFRVAAALFFRFATLN